VTLELEGGYNIGHRDEALRFHPPEKYPLAGETRPLDYQGWESIGADIVIAGKVARARDELVVRVEIHAVRERTTAFATEYSSKGSARELTHYIADSLLSRFGRAGIARTEIAFASDRADGHKDSFAAEPEVLPTKRNLLGIVVRSVLRRQARAQAPEHREEGGAHLPF